MPCPHFDVKIIQRSKRQSAVASAAYQSGERLFSEYDQKQKYYSHKSEVVHTEIMLPPHAPPEYADRNTLWNAAEAIEKQWNSQLARRLVLAIPRDIPPAQQADLIRDYCREFFVSKGMIADFAIHDKGDGNPHAHILFTMRGMDEQGRWLPKSRKVYDLDENGERIRLPSGNWKSHKEDTVDWNDQKYGEIWRQAWQDTANRYLEAIGSPERLNLKSYERQGIDKIPTVHMGPAVSYLERKGIQTNIGNLNRDIKAANSLMQSIRQMVRSLNAYFASFYAPMMLSSSGTSVASRPYDYLYHYRCDQDMIGQNDVAQLAQKHNVDITTWVTATGSILGTDGMEHIETESSIGVTYTEEYRELLQSATFLPERAYNAITGQKIDLAPGTCANVLDDDGGSSYLSGGDVTHLTNMVTGKNLDVTPAEPLPYTMLLGCYVLDDRDYETISAGVTDQWQEDYVFFNVADVEASFPFAKALFYDIVDHSGPEVEVFDAWDPVARQIAIEETGSYFFDPESLEESGTSSIDYDKPDSTEFRTSWKYMPQFKILDETELVKTMAVFLMLFIFIAIVCFAAVIVISFTRCMTIGMTNARVYDDLRHLGAPRSYLYRSVKGQVSRVFRVPILVGTILIYAFYTLIMYSNGEPMGITPSEASGMITCLGVIAVVSLLLYLVYRLTLKKVCSVTIDSKTASPH